MPLKDLRLLIVVKDLHHKAVLWFDKPFREPDARQSVGPKPKPKDLRGVKK
jgi:hypothetical protein